MFQAARRRRALLLTSAMRHVTSAPINPPDDDEVIVCTYPVFLCRSTQDSIRLQGNWEKTVLEIIPESKISFINGDVKVSTSQCVRVPFCSYSQL